MPKKKQAVAAVRAPTQTIYINRNDSSSLPPEDGTYVSITVLGPIGQTAAVFDKKLNRWFTGRGAAINPASIVAWEKPL
jgi:hypothetical protein